MPELGRGQLVERPRVADLVLRDRRERDVLLEEGRDPGPLRVPPAEEQLVVGDREQQVGPLAHSASAARRGLERSRLLTSFAQPRLDRVPVDAAVLHLELVGELLDLAHRLSRNEPEGDRLLPPAVLLARVDLGEALVGRRDRAGVLERLALPLLSEDLEHHLAQAASASTTRSTQATSSRESLRKASRSSEAGPCPVTTARSFSQSGSV